MIADPAKGAAMVAKRNPAADVALETRRLKLSIDANVVTDYTKANGMGNVDKARMKKAMMQLTELQVLEQAGHVENLHGRLPAQGRQPEAELGRFRPTTTRKGGRHPPPFRSQPFQATTPLRLGPCLQTR